MSNSFGQELNIINSMHSGRVEASNQVNCNGPYSQLTGAALDALINETVAWWLAKQGLTKEQAEQQYLERLQAEE